MSLMLAVVMQTPAHSVQDLRFAAYVNVVLLIDLPSASCEHS